MNDVIYKIAEISDIDQILKIGNLLSDFELSDNEHSFWSEETLKNCINDPSSGIIACAMLDNKLAGFAIIQYNIVFSTATIDQLFILPKYRNLGIGKKLYQLILDNVKSKKITELSMNVEFGNKSVIDFFEYNGFDKTMNTVNLKLKIK